MLLLSVTMGIPFHEVRQWSAAEILLYQCYYRIAPFGDERADLRNAMQMSQTANMYRDTKTKPDPFEVTDFMPFAERPEPEQTGSEPAGLRDVFLKMTERK